MPSVIMDFLSANPFEACLSLFNRSVVKTQQFYTCYTLYSMLKDNALTSTERLAAIYIMLEFSKFNDQCFVSALCEITEHSETLAERILLQEWLNGRDFSGYSVSQALNLTGEFRELEIAKKTRVVRPLVNANGFSKEALEQLGRYEAEYLRPLPDMMDVRASEVKWITPGFIPSLLWDIDLDLDDTCFEVRELLNMSLSTTLTNEQLNYFRDSIDSNPQVLGKLGFRPEHLSEMVMTNTELAGDLLMRIYNSPDMSDYFGVLLELRVCVQSMDLMNRLINEMEVPSEVTITFVSNSIRFCKSIRDPGQQKRSVRLLCVFVQRLLVSRVVNLTQINSNIIALCTEFHTLPEAVELLRTLR